MQGGGQAYNINTNTKTNTNTNINISSASLLAEAPLNSRQWHVDQRKGARGREGGGGGGLELYKRQQLKVGVAP